MKQNLLSILVMLFCAFVLQAQDTLSKYSPIQRTIVVKGDLDFPPYEFINKEGKYDGFNVELFHVLAKNLNLDIHLTLEPWHVVKDEIETGKIDVVTGMFIDSIRSQSILFGTPHGIMTYGLFIHRTLKITDPDDLKDYTVVVQKNDIMHEILLRERWTDSILLAENPRDMLRWVEEGKADAALLGSLQGEFIIKDEKLKDVVLCTSEVTPFKYAIGVKMGEPDLLWTLNTGLYQLKVDGTYDKLYQKWLGVYEQEIYLKKALPYIVPFAIIFLLLLAFVFVLYRQVESSLRKQKKMEKQLSAVSSIAPIGIGILSNHVLTVVNDYFSSIIGFDREKIEGAPFMQLFYSDDEYSETYNNLIRQLKATTSAPVEAHWKNKKGESVFVLLTAAYFDQEKGCEELLLTVTDTTSQRNAMRQLYIANERLKLHLDNSPLGYLELDNQLRITEWSAQAESIFGWKKSEVIGENIYELDFVYKLDYLQVEKAFRKLFSKEEKRNINRHKNKTKHGVLVDCVWYNSAVYDTSGELTSIFCLANDVSDLKRAQSQIAEEQQLSQWIIDSAQVGTWEWNILTSKGVVNDYYAALLGYTKDEISNFSVEELKEMVHPQDKERVLTVITECLNSKINSIDLELRLRHKDGHYLSFLKKGSIIVKQGSDSSVFAGILTDVTHTRKVEEFIRKLSIATDQSPASVIITDMDGYIEYINQKFINVTGYTFDELRGKMLRIFKSGHLSDEDYNKMIHSIRSGKAWSGEHQNRKKNREKYWESVLISPILNEEGEIINFVAVSEDITERKAIQQELVNAKEKAEESDRLKTAFLNNLSHEVRTPLNAIAGFSEILHEELVSDDKKANYAAEIVKSSRQLLLMMENIINISIVETGMLIIQNAETDINEFLNEVYNQMVLLSVNPSIELRIKSLVPRSTGRVLLDQVKLSQILSNLIINGYKYSSKGIVEVTCRIKDNSIHFSVSDEGIGIPDSIKETIFERFLQGNNAVTGVNQGLGIGLSVVKSYLDLLGGTISFESQEGKGTTFYFSIPFEWAAGKYEKATTVNNWDWTKDKKILVVDDVKANYEVISGMLDKSYIEVLYAKDGYKAVEKVQKNEDISLIIMDINMPEMNGWETIRQIRETRPDVPIIVHTAYSLVGEKEKMDELNCNDYLLKPLNTKSLIAVLKKHL